MMQSQLKFKTLNLPKGSANVQSVHDDASVEALTGALNFHYPIFCTPCRDFTPEISLHYASSNSNSAFGLGVALDIPCIKLATKRQSPRYDGKDAYSLSGVGYLVPLKQQSPETQVIAGKRYTLTLYCPDANVSYSRIERWQNQDNPAADVFWRVISADHIVQIFGYRTQARISDPADASKIYQWCLEEAYDALGQHHLYQYKAEDLAGAPAQLPVSEKNREQTANRYISHVYYGNNVACADSLLLTASQMVDDPKSWYFECVFDYGEYDTAITQADPYATGAQGTWVWRQDSFSNYLAGFEVRTHRLCRQVLMFHRFSELGSVPRLVHSTRLLHQAGLYAGFNLLLSVQESGYNFLAQEKVAPYYEKLSLPALNFSHSDFQPSVTATDYDSLSHADGGALMGMARATSYHLVDLYSAGLPGILYADGSTVNYAAPQWNGQKIVYQKPQLISFPFAHDMQSGTISLSDINGNGYVDAVIESDRLTGYCQMQINHAWQVYRPFISYPSDLYQQQQHWIDSNGNGLLDKVQLNAGVLTINTLVRSQENLLDVMWTEATQVVLQDHLDFPSTFESSKTVLTTFAAMGGAGLAQLVQVSQNKVIYWPNLGYGKFASPITMDNAPDFGEDFSVQRLFLGDLDGSGLADLVYAFSDKLHIYINQSGNGFLSKPIELKLPVDYNYDDIDKIDLIDLYGSGSAGILMRYLTKDHVPAYHYYPISKGIKPYLLTDIDNQRGSVTQIEYTSSVQEYLRDEQGMQPHAVPWATRLCFPVQVVKSITVKDNFRQVQKVQTHYYHHGYHSGIDQEFRGFAYIETVDEHHFPAPTQATEPTDYVYIKPRLTRTWYHLGLEDTDLTIALKKTYFSADALAFASRKDALPNSGNIEDTRQAFRSLKGEVIRREVYEYDDPTDKNQAPYELDEYSYEVVCDQVRGEYLYGSYRVQLREHLHYSYEQQSSDPRIEHNLQLQCDAYGHVLQSLNVVYPRRTLKPAQSDLLPQQQQYHLNCTLQKYINKSDNAQDYLLGVCYESMQYAVHDLLPSVASQAFDYDEVKNSIQQRLQALTTKSPSSDTMTLHAWHRHYYAAVNEEKSLTQMLALGEVSLPKLNYCDAAVTFSFKELALAFSDVPSAINLVSELEKGFYSNKEAPLITDYWWAYSNHPVYYGLKQFYQEQGVVDAANILAARYQYDAYCLLMIKVVDALDNTIRCAGIDYRHMLATTILDINDNTAEVCFDALGRVIFASHSGVEEGDQQRGFAPIAVAPAIRPASLSEFLTKPQIYIGKMACCYYYTDEVDQDGNPVAIATISATEYPDSIAEPSAARLLLSVDYFDGFGDIMQHVNSVETGDAYVYNPLKKTLDTSQKMAASRWHNSGHLLADIKCYRPFYVNTFSYVPYNAVAKTQPTATVYHDAMGERYQAQSAKGFINQRLQTAWIYKQYDENDAILLSPYYLANNAESPDPGSPFYDVHILAEERAALSYTAKYHANTPITTSVDNRGFGVQTIKQNKWQDQSGMLQTEFLLTRVDYDDQGRIVSITDARNNEIVRYTQGQFAQTLKHQEADAGARWQLADVFERHLWSCDARGTVINTQYDVLHRPISQSVIKTKKTKNDPLCLQQTVKYFVYGETVAQAKNYNLRGQRYQLYDEAGLVTLYSATIGGSPLHSTREFHRNYQVEVDWPQSLPDRMALLDGTLYSELMQYDAIERITCHTDALGNDIMPSYYPSGRLAQVTMKAKGEASAKTYLNGLQYDADDQVVACQLGSGTQCTIQYEVATGRIRTLCSLARNANVLQDITYAYDPVANIVAKIGHEPPACYAYDALYRLIEAQGHRSGDQHYVERYSYQSKSQNLVKRQRTAGGQSITMEMVVSDKNNRALSTAINGDPSRAPTPAQVNDYFDSCGNAIKMEGLSSLAWDYRQQLQKVVRAVHPDGTEDAEYYVYNSVGQRLRKVQQCYITPDDGLADTRLCVDETFYLGDVELHRHLLGSSLSTLKLVSAYYSRRLYEVATYNQWLVGDAPGGGRYFTMYHHKDQLGSSTIDTDEMGDIIHQSSYYPFGETAMDKSDSKAIDQLKHHRYAGKEKDAISGLYYYGSRYYAAWLGRWLNPDPSGFINGLNRYAFVDNNPITHTDIDGDAIDLTIKKSGAVMTSFSISGRYGNQNDATVQRASMPGKMKKPPRGWKHAVAPVEHEAENPARAGAMKLDVLHLAMAHFVSAQELNHVLSLVGSMRLSGDTSADAKFKTFLAKLLPKSGRYKFGHPMHPETAKYKAFMVNTKKGSRNSQSLIKSTRALASIMNKSPLNLKAASSYVNSALHESTDLHVYTTTRGKFRVTAEAMDIAESLKALYGVMGKSRPAKFNPREKVYRGEKYVQLSSVETNKSYDKGIEKAKPFLHIKGSSGWVKVTKVEGYHKTHW